MIETEITISINRKSDFDLVKQTIIAKKFDFPIVILEFEYHYQLSFTSNYEEWELDTAILECFPDYEFSSSLGNGNKEIRLQISRYQSDLSFDNWGRQIPDPLDETKYLIKRSNEKPEKFNRKVRVLFDENEYKYCINIFNGINKKSGEEGFLLGSDFKNNSNGVSKEILKDKLYKSSHEAFHSGCYKLQKIIHEDYNKYIENKKKETKKIQRIPRKTIRDFIKSCNNFDSEEILKNIDNKIVFEKAEGWKKQLIFEGIDGFKKYINSSNPEIISKGYSIDSNWIFELPEVTIRTYYYPKSEENSMRKYEKWSFLLNRNKIVRIIKK